MNDLEKALVHYALPLLLAEVAGSDDPAPVAELNEKFGATGPRRSGRS